MKRDISKKLSLLLCMLIVLSLSILPAAATDRLPPTPVNIIDNFDAGIIEYTMVEQEFGDIVPVDASMIQEHLAIIDVLPSKMNAKSSIQNLKINSIVKIKETFAVPEEIELPLEERSHALEPQDIVDEIAPSMEGDDPTKATYSDELVDPATDFVEPQELPIQAAAVSSLTVSNLALDAGVYEPLPLNQYIPYTFVITNAASTQVVSISMSIYDNGTYLGEMWIGTLPGNCRATGGFELAANSGISHTIKLLLNSGSTTSRTFTFSAGGADLYASKIVSSLGDRFEMGKTVVFTCDIINWGPLPVTSATYMFSVNGRGLMFGTLPNMMPANTMQTITFTMIMDAPGDHTVKLETYPTVPSYDPNTQNNSCTKVVTVPSIPLFAGKWANATNLSVDVIEGVQSLISLADLTTAIKQWNGISSNVSYGTVTVVQDEIYMTAPIKVKLDTTIYTSNAGLCESYTSTGVPLNDYNLFTDKESYGYAWVSLFTATLSGQPSSIVQKVVTHEFGHALGMAHIYESAATVMRPKVEQMAVSSPSQMDKTNLKIKYD